jgi:hypothetical protein
MNLPRLRQAEVDPVPWLGNIDVAVRIRGLLHQRSQNLAGLLVSWIQTKHGDEAAESVHS